MPLSARAQELVELYDAIIARAKGSGVSSAGHKGRQVAYANTNLKEMIEFYRAMWTPALGAETGLPLLNELGSSSQTRGLIRLRPIP